jgi:hypothetical protein
MVNLVLQPLNTGEWSGNQSSEGCLGPRAGLDAQTREFQMLGIEPRVLGGPSRNLVTLTDRLISIIAKICGSKRKRVPLQLRY